MSRRSGPAHIIVGRSRDCDLVLSDPSVSGRHLRLTWDDKRIVVEDLASANGTFIRGSRVTRIEVRPGEEVRMGSVLLPWSARPLRAFLRSGAGDTFIGLRIRGRRFICGSCGTRGVLPPRSRRVAVTCNHCGAALVLERSRDAVVWAVGGFCVAAVAAVSLWAVFSPTPRNALEAAVERLGIASNPSATREERSVRVHTAPRIVDALDPENPTTRNAAVRIASTENGPFNLEQVARVWTHTRGRWRYVNDPRGAEYFAAASETIKDGYAGDCDDFAIVLAAMLTSIGGRSRVVMMDGPDGGHAYAEVCIEQAGPVVARRLARHYRRNWDRYLGRQRVREIHYRSSGDCPVWLNLDWNAGVPGGPYGAEQWAVAIYTDGDTEALAPAELPEGKRVPRTTTPGVTAPPR